MRVCLCECQYTGFNLEIYWLRYVLSFTDLSFQLIWIWHSYFVITFTLFLWQTEPIFNWKTIRAFRTSNTQKNASKFLLKLYYKHKFECKTLMDFDAFGTWCTFFYLYLIIIYCQKYEQLWFFPPWTLFSGEHGRKRKPRIKIHNHWNGKWFCQSGVVRSILFWCDSLEICYRCRLCMITST